MTYFIRTGATQYTATEFTGGGWNTEEQHIAPTIGLVAHLAEQDHAARREEPLQIARMTHEIFGVVPIAAYDYEVRVLRPGRTIELVEVELRHADRVIVNSRVWFMQAGDTTAIAGSPLPALTPRDEMDDFPPVTDWQGAYLKTLEGRRKRFDAGRSHFWGRTTMQLVDDVAASPFALMCGMNDIANGMAVRNDPRDVAFPNVDLSTHVFRQPDLHAFDGQYSDWVGYDISVSFGPTGAGLTHTVLHDAHGPFAVQCQSLTVRP